jgi:hypothetical protein
VTRAQFIQRGASAPFFIEVSRDMDMKEVVEFLQRYIQQEYEVIMAKYTELDYNAFQKKIPEVDQFYSSEDGIYYSLTRPREMSPAEWEEMAAAGKALRPRVLFQVKKYKHSKLGEVCRAYLSGEKPSAQGRFMQLVSVAGTEEGMRIISMDRMCLSCGGNGKIGDAPCKTCKGVGFQHAEGRKLGKLGPLLENNRLQAPTHPKSLADYEAESA